MVQFRSLFLHYNGYFSKGFGRLKLKINFVHYFELRRHMNNGFSLNFIAIYDRLLYFWGRNCLFRDCFQNLVYLLRVSMWECSSVVEHSTADPEVGGSIPLAHFFVIVGCLSKDFRSLKN